MIFVRGPVMNNDLFRPTLPEIIFENLFQSLVVYVVQVGKLGQCET